MRNKFADVFYEMGKKDPRLSLVVADISPAGSIAKFREEFPDRFVNTGVAEQIMIGMTAGMAQRGMRPFAYTIATFTMFRPYEFIRVDLCYQNLPVTLVGIGGGVTYSTLGATHHAMEDVALACATPNLRVIAPCDPLEVEAATRWCAIQEEGPVYLRLGKAGEANFSENAETPWEYGKIRYLRRGADVCIFTYGPIVKMAWAVADKLEAKGKSVSIISVHTIKPLDKDGIKEALAAHKEGVVIEEMVPTGGVADKIKGVAYETSADCSLKCFTLKDEFIHNYGTHEDVLEAHGLSAEKIYASL